MFTSLQNPFTLIGRILLAALYLPAGFGKVTDFAGTVAEIASRGVPFPQLAATAAVGVELGLATLLLIGWQARWAALGIAFFTVVVSFIFHDFWAVPADQVTQQAQSFFKNIAVVGGLLTVAGWGAGAWSFDGKADDE